MRVKSGTAELLSGLGGLSALGVTAVHRQHWKSQNQTRAAARRPYSIGAVGATINMLLFRLTQLTKFQRRQRYRLPDRDHKALELPGYRQDTVTLLSDPITPVLPSTIS